VTADPSYSVESQVAQGADSSEGENNEVASMQPEPVGSCFRFKQESQRFAGRKDQGSVRLCHGQGERRDSCGVWDKRLRGTLYMVCFFFKPCTDLILFFRISRLGYGPYGSGSLHMDGRTAMCDDVKVCLVKI
jgi:hypothetical protein